MVGLLLLAAQNSIPVGWHDELATPGLWVPLDGGTQPIVRIPRASHIELRFAPQTADWPYQFQWGGVRRFISFDPRRHPVIIARVTDVQGYAHLEIEDERGRGLRSSAVQSPGYVRLDMPADKSMQRYELRLIGGGPNSGASVTYDWVRCTTAQGAARMIADPNARVVIDP